MAERDDTIKETTNAGEQRRNPRFPNSTVWSEEDRRRHREERDSVLEDAGLVTDRMIEDGTEVGAANDKS